MKRFIIFSVAMLLIVQFSFTQENIQNINYTQKAVCSILFSNTDQPLCSFIDTAFITTPIFDQYVGYVSHDLGVNIISLKEPIPAIEKIRVFLEQNKIAGRLVAKWFHRNPYTGECDLSKFGLSKEINASNIEPVTLSQISEQLSNTYVMINDVRYVPKVDAGRVVGNIMGTLSYMTIGIGYWRKSPMQDLLFTLKHFQVVVTSHLYRLVWNENKTEYFLSTMYTDKPDIIKRDEFNNNMDKFHLLYLGSAISESANLSPSETKDMDYSTIVQTAYSRAIDENISKLSQINSDFGLKMYIESTTPIIARIGKREGVTNNTLFEVIDPKTNQQIAVIKPIAIWDNTYNAIEDNSIQNYLAATIFKQLSGEQIQPGMQIRRLQN